MSELLTNIPVKYPEYTVSTPQSVKQFTVRSLNVQDEEKLKGSYLSPNQFAQHINQIIFDCLVKRPDDFKTYDDFITKLSIKDRDALLYALYHVTYKDINNYEIRCAECENKYDVSLDISKAFSMVAWKADENPVPLQDREFPVRLPISDTITAVLKQPTLKAEEVMMGDMLFQSKKNLDVGVELLVIDRFEIDKEGAVAGQKNIIKERDNVFHLYNKLPSRDRKAINKEYAAKLGKYGVELKVETRCTKCGAESSTYIDLITQFFRSLYE